MKIGIFGCTADPFTLAHLAIATAANKMFDSVYIVPTKVNYYRTEKSPMFGFVDKCTIIQEILARTKAPSSIEIDTIERDKGEEWRTLHTVKYFHEKFPNDELFLIIGSDSYRNFDTWFQPDEILQYCKLCVVPRSGETLENYDGLTLEIPKKYQGISATSIRQKLTAELIDVYLADIDWYNH